MIAPDMATMLCFVFTDAAIPAAALQALLGRAWTAASTASPSIPTPPPSDTVLLFATGQAAHTRTAEGPTMLADFAGALDECCWTWRCRWCATARARRSWSNRCRGRGQSTPRPSASALAIANSPLVKTAIAGEDANWGRIVMAVGKAGEPADRDKLVVAVGGVWMAATAAWCQAMTRPRWSPT